jgi:hypothetical protein
MPPHGASHSVFGFARSGDVAVDQVLVKEAVMPEESCGGLFGAFCMTVGVLLLSLAPLRAQDAGKDVPAGATPAASSSVSPGDLRALADSVRELEDQVRVLNAQVSELRAESERDSEETRELRGELDAARAQLAARAAIGGGSDASASLRAVSASSPQSSAPGAADQGSTIEDRVATLEDDQQLSDAKLVQQEQTKVESGSKYRVRLSGIVLLNLFANRGVVDNQDFPGIAEEREPMFDSAGTFGGTLRQSQIGLEAFGPDLAGAHTSANVRFDFSGGFPDVPNGTTMGIVRLRTGTIRLDWTNTSIIAGQDYLFFAPVSPTSYASLAVPPLSYAGNLWAWTPQVRVEHHFHFSESSSVLVQGGILDSMSGDLPVAPATFVPSWGEQSGEPAYAARVSWTQRAFGEDLTIGTGAYYGRQFWGFSRSVDAWASTIDATVPLGNLFALSGEFYRGRALGGLGGGVGQDVLMSGAFTDPATVVKGLDSTGGWLQLKFKPTVKFQINGAIGDDNPFSSELRRFPSSTSYYGPLIARNLSPFVNFIYQPRSDMLFSLEYRSLKTYYFADEPYSAHNLNLSLGYLF